MKMLLCGRSDARAEGDLPEAKFEVVSLKFEPVLKVG